MSFRKCLFPCFEQLRLRKGATVDKKYRIVFLGLLKGPVEFAQGMSGLGVGFTAIEEMIQKVPVVMKGGMTLREARAYADAVQEAGGRVNIQEHGFFEESRQLRHEVEIKALDKFTECPECGFKQLKGGACVKCGFVFHKEKGSA
jgi:rubredoxin